MYTEIIDRDFEDHLRAPEASLLLLLWRMGCNDQEIASEQALPVDRLGYLMPSLMILHPTADGTDWTYAHYGSTIASIAGFDMTGRKVSDFHGPLRDFYLDVYGRVTRERCPLASVHRLGDFGETPLWERLILPLGEGGKVTALYVINKVREIEQDISHISARARGRARIILQFLRNETGEICDAIIVGANARARELSGRRLDEMIGRKALEVLPGIRDAGIWERVRAVGLSRENDSLSIDYRADGINSLFDLEISPMLDGVCVDFQPHPVRISGGKAA